MASREPIFDSRARQRIRGCGRVPLDSVTWAWQGPRVDTTQPDDPRLAIVQSYAANGTPLRGLEFNGITLTSGDLGSAGALDFSQCDLRGVTFAHVDLSDCLFREADLSGASFLNANLTRADLRGCSARGAVFTDVNLAYSQFAESDLRGSLFFNANMADISFKGASLDGSEVDAVRLSLNGGTHVLGLKEALRGLADESSYPYIAGVSGDAFWLSYFLKMRDINWGGFPKDVLRRGLANFGFPCDFVDEVEEGDAWSRLTEALAEGASVITPLHVSASTVLGAGFGGAEWVFVTGIDRGDVLVNCLMGDALRFSRERFLAGWCQHHPAEEAADDLPVIYAMCVVRPREHAPSRSETTRSGLRAAVEVLTLPSTEKVAFGFDAYTQMLGDLQTPQSPADLPPDESRRFLPWLGLGVLHHHGSRWAIRDFLDEVLERDDGFGSDERSALSEARDLYHAACGDLQSLLESMPWGFDVPDESERVAAIRSYEANRERGADLLRSAAAHERDALERFKAIVGPQ